MNDELFDARLSIIDTIRGIMLYEANLDQVEDEEQQVEMIEAIGDLVEIILEELKFEVVSVDGQKVTATLELEPD